MSLCEPCGRIRFGGSVSKLVDLDATPVMGPVSAVSVRDDRPSKDDRPDIMDNGLYYGDHHNNLTELESCAKQPNGCDLCRVFLWCYRKKGEGNENHPLCIKVFPLIGSKMVEVFLLNSSSEPEARPRTNRFSFPLFLFKLLLMGLRGGIIGSHSPYPIKASRPSKWLTRVRIVPQGSTESAAISEAYETNFGDPAPIDRAKRWISECLYHHPACKETSGKKRYLPARVLNVAISESRVFLEINKEKLGDYVALSYCWGRAKQVKLAGTYSKSRFEKKGISVSTLPKTIQDAIRITRDLGFHYLWVDALCIIQNSKKDLNREKARMDIVYSSATVTLFATGGFSADDGIFSQDQPRRMCSISVPQAQEKFDVFADIPDEEIRDGLGYPWNSRGWTMQEYISAPRGIIYTDSQMGWFCLTRAKKGDNDWISQEDERTHIIDVMASTTVLNDNFEQISHFWRVLLRFADLDSSVMSRRHLRDSITHQFYAIPNELNDRCFTYESDKLEAVASIAKTTELRLLQLTLAEIREGDNSKKWTVNPPKYWVGLWDDDWAYGLFWKEEKESPRSKRPKHVLKRPEGEPCIPSWSWASVLYSCHQSFSEHMESAPTSHIKDVITPPLFDQQENPKDSDKISENERFVPTKPLPLRLTAPLLRLSDDWKTPKSLSKASYNVSAGFEARVREQLHISSDWTSFLQDEPESERRTLQAESKSERKDRLKKFLRANDKREYVVIQVLSWEVPSLYYEEAFYLILEQVPRPKRTPETPKRYRRIASLSQRGVLPVNDAEGKPRSDVKSWRDTELERAKGRKLSDHLDRNKFEPTRRELIFPSLLELVRRDPPWQEIKIELV